MPNDTVSRKTIVLNVANRVCIAMQEVVDALDWGHRVECIYEVCTHPNEYIRGRYTIVVNERPYTASQLWDVQMLLDLRGEYDKVVRRRTSHLMAELSDKINKEHAK